MLEPHRFSQRFDDEHRFAEREHGFEAYGVPEGPMYSLAITTLSK